MRPIDDGGVARRARVSNSLVGKGATVAEECCGGTVDRLADGEPRVVVAPCKDDTGHIHAESRGELQRHKGLHPPRPDCDVNRVDAAGAHLDEDLSGTRLRLGHVLQREDVRSTELIDPCSAHGHSHR